MCRWTPNQSIKKWVGRRVEIFNFFVLNCNLWNSKWLCVSRNMKLLLGTEWVSMWCVCAEKITMVWLLRTKRHSLWKWRDDHPFLISLSCMHSFLVEYYRVIHSLRYSKLDSGRVEPVRRISFFSGIKASIRWTVGHFISHLSWPSSSIYLLFWTVAQLSTVCVLLMRGSWVLFFVYVYCSYDRQHFLLHRNSLF